MCTGLEIVALIGSALSAGGAVHQAQQTRKAAKEQEALAILEAKQERSAAEIYAERIRRQRRAAQGEAKAALAAAGVRVDSGTALDIDAEIAADSAMDAYLTILGGVNNAGRITRQSRINTRAANQQAAAGYLNAAGSLLSGASNLINTGWKR